MLNTCKLLHTAPLSKVPEQMYLHSTTDYREPGNTGTSRFVSKIEIINQSFKITLAFVITQITKNPEDILTRHSRKITQ